MSADVMDPIWQQLAPAVEDGSLGAAAAKIKWDATDKKGTDCIYVQVRLAWRHLR